MTQADKGAEIKARRARVFRHGHEDASTEKMHAAAAGEWGDGGRALVTSEALHAALGVSGRRGDVGGNQYGGAA